MSQSQIKTRNRISLASHAGERGSFAGWIGAISLHVAIVAATLFTFAHRLDIADESAPIVPVDLITIAPKTNITPTAPSEPKVQPAPAPAVTVQPPVEQPPVPQEDTEPPPVDTAPSEPVLEKAPPPPLPRQRPQQQPNTKKPETDSINALITQLAGASAPTKARSDNRTRQGFGPQTAMTADLQDALRSQIRPCWSPPVGAPHPEQLIVDFDLFLNPDGSVAQPPQLAADSAAAAASNPYVRAAAEAARRAIYTCQPYKLPADRYSTWREINPFRFDPREMVGQ